MNIIVVGAGIGGIYSSLLLKKKYPESEVYLVEKSQKIGGLYSSFVDSKAGTFDKGMHIFYETLNEDIDKILYSALPEDQWIRLEGNRKDLAGVFHDNTLDTSSPYVSLESLPLDRSNECLKHLLLALEKPAKGYKDCKNLREFFSCRFGDPITDYLIEPIVEKLWHKASKDLHPSSSRIVLMDRVKLFSKDAMHDLALSSNIRSRIAFPNQLELPITMRSKQSGLYPKKYGLDNVLNGLKKILNVAGVKVYSNASVKDLSLSSSKIQSATIVTETQTTNIDNIQHFVWTLPPSSLLQIMNLKNAIDTKNLDKPLTQKYVYLLSSIEPKMNGVYYYYSFQKGTHAFRVTNYSAYCENSIRLFNGKKHWPICVEMHYPSNSNPDDKSVLDQTVKELLQSSILNSRSNITYSNVVSIPSGFPLLTLDNCDYLATTRSKVNSLSLTNLTLAGQKPEEGIFYLHETLSLIHSLFCS